MPCRAGPLIFESEILSFKVLLKSSATRVQPLGIEAAEAAAAEVAMAGTLIDPWWTAEAPLQDPSRMILRTS